MPRRLRDVAVTCVTCNVTHRDGQRREAADADAGAGETEMRKTMKMIREDGPGVASIVTAVA